jgi:hypothetical protein
VNGSAKLVVVDVQKEDQTCLKVSISLSVEEKMTALGRVNAAPGN